ncbi:hypothetical protein STEG23_032139, partial [Scotinomys teguina]
MLESQVESKVRGNGLKEPSSSIIPEEKHPSAVEMPTKNSISEEDKTRASGSGLTQEHMSPILGGNSIELEMGEQRKWFCLLFVLLERYSTPGNDAVDMTTEDLDYCMHVAAGLERMDSRFERSSAEENFHGHPNLQQLPPDQSTAIDIYRRLSTGKGLELAKGFSDQCMSGFHLTYASGMLTAREKPTEADNMMKEG